MISPSQEQNSLPTVKARSLEVPFFRPSLGEEEIAEVVNCLRTGWLTTGPRTRQFETEFAAAVGAKHAVALNSCTAALHLAVEALGLRRGQAVLVPTHTFAATAEIVQYGGGVPVLVDCEPHTLNIDLADAERKLAAAQAGELAGFGPLEVVGVIPVHVAGYLIDHDELREFAKRNRLWVVEDAAHAFPAAQRATASSPWQQCGEGTADVSCFSFYANKTITTGEGGMAVTNSPELADRIRQMSLHGLSHEAWKRYSGGSRWDYRILAPGYKYNLTDIASAIGIHQLRRAEEMRQQRESIATHYLEALEQCEALELPPVSELRLHSWHLFPLKLRLNRLAVDRNTLVDRLRERGVGFSVHWRPLHLHPLYAEQFGWSPDDFPHATAVWPRLVSLPLFPGMREEEIEHVIDTVRQLCFEFDVHGH